MRFDKLNDEAKERARAWYREVSDGDSFYSEHVLDDAKDVLKVLGYSSIKISYSGFSSQGDGAQFTGNFYASDFDDRGTNAIQALLVDRPTDKELARCVAELDSILSTCGSLSASIEHYGHYSHEMATRFYVDFGDEDFEEGGEPFDTAELQDRFIEVSRDLMRWIYKSLRDAYEWERSDEVVDDSIRANEYEFTEEGELA